MKLTEIIIKRPLSAIIVMIGIILFGASSMLGMPQELTPEMNMPMLLVTTVYPTAGPEDVEELVTREIEGAVSSLSGIKQVGSYSMENISIVMMEYEYGTNMDIAYTDAKESIDRIINSLPDDTQRPTVMELDMNAMDTISLSVRSRGGENMLAYIEDEIVPEFTKLSAVADVSVYGGQEEYIRVELMEEKLRQYGVNMNTVTGSVSTADFSLPTGSVDFGSQSLTARSSVEYETVRALENIPIPLGNGGIIRLADVAKVYTTTKDASSISRYNGEDNISLGIQKRQSASAVTVSRQVMQVVEEFNASQDQFTIDVVNDNSDTIQSSIRTVGQSLILAIILSMIVLFLFLGDIKASMIVATSMPISLLVAFTLMDFMGFSLNVVTMSAMVLGVGMMVDNSIVVLDSCFKAHGPGKDHHEAALEGVKTVLGSIIGSTITTVVVFFPLATIKGMSGQLFTPLGFTIIFSLTASLFSAITLTPLFFVQFRPEERRNAPAARGLKRLERAYSRFLRKLLGKKKTTFFVTLALIAVAGLLASQLNRELIPSVDQGVVQISLETRPGLKLERVDELVTELETLAASHPDVEHVTVSGGGSGLNMLMGGGSASVTAYLKKDREKTTDEVVEEWRYATRDILDCSVTVSSSSMTMQMTSSDAVVMISGSELDDLRDFLVEIEDVMKQNPGILTVTSSMSTPSPQAEIVVDQMKAAAVGLTPYQVAGTVSTALGGADTVTIRQNDQNYDIRVEYPDGKYETVNDLRNLMLVAPTGASVPLMDIASIQFTDSPQTIMKLDNRFYATVTGTPLQEGRFETTKQVYADVAAMDFPSGVVLEQNSTDESMIEEFTAIGMAILTAVWLVFMVLVIQFESIRHAIMVMLCIPFSMIGSLGLMFLTGTTISMVSLLGFLILVGTVVNNGILFVDTVNQYRLSMELKTALVYAGRNRMRPILMTTLTTILSMVPMAFATGSAAMMAGLAYVVIGGLLVSTVLTLILLPTFYLMIDGNPEKRQKRLEKRRARRERKKPVTE